MRIARYALLEGAREALWQTLYNMPFSSMCVAMVGHIVNDDIGPSGPRDTVNSEWLMVD